MGQVIIANYWISCKHGGRYWLPDASKEISVFSACKEEIFYMKKVGISNAFS